MVHLPQSEPSIQSCAADNKALPDYGFDDGARRLCFMGRYFWLSNNLLELFNLMNNDMYYQCMITHATLICHVRDE